MSDKNSDSTKTTNANSLHITAKALAQELGIAVQTLAKWRCCGGGPEFVRCGGAIRYSRKAIDKWINSRTGTSTTELATH